jgi:hypothetical protein
MLIKLDALFEIVLGAAVLVAAASGALGDEDFPRPVGTVVLLIVGAVLILLGFAIWRYRVGKTALVFGNAVSALLGIVGLATVSGFSDAGTAVIAVTVAGLACLAAAQAATLRA